MTNHLGPIILQKKSEVAELKNLLHTCPDHLIGKLLIGKMTRTAKRNFAEALCQKELAIIAEIKRKSPSKGVLSPIIEPVLLAQKYIQGGAQAISILTDQLFFGGYSQDLIDVSQISTCPLLRKDFLIDEIQIAEAIALGADAVLCIVAITGHQTKKIIEAANEMNIDILVEVHTRAELEIALHSEAKIIGVNNRDLNTFKIDPQNAFNLLEHIPPHIIKVAESGIVTPELAHAYFRAGFNAVLIGEALVTSSSPEQFIQACRHA